MAIEVDIYKRIRWFTFVLTGGFIFFLTIASCHIFRISSCDNKIFKGRNFGRCVASMDDKDCSVTKNKIAYFIAGLRERPKKK